MTGASRSTLLNHLTLAFEAGRDIVAELHDDKIVTALYTKYPRVLDPEGDNVPFAAFARKQGLGLSLAVGALKPNDKVSFAVRPRLDLVIEHDGTNCAGFEHAHASRAARTSDGTIVEHCRGQSCHSQRTR